MVTLTVPEAESRSDKFEATCCGPLISKEEGHGADIKPGKSKLNNFKLCAERRCVVWLCVYQLSTLGVPIQSPKMNSRARSTSASIGAKIPRNKEPGRVLPDIVKLLCKKEKKNY